MRFWAVVLLAGCAAETAADLLPRGSGVPTLLAPRVGAVEDANRQLMVGDIHGLYGLSTMGNRKLRIDAASSSIWFEP